MDDEGDAQDEVGFMGPIEDDVTRAFR
jgi:hypothetical protein